MELYYDNLAGDMWTPKEKAVFKRKGKTPVVINDLKPAERTILGLFIQNKYDVKFAPREETQDISDVLQKLYAWTAYSQNWAYKDIETVRQAWCGGVGYQEVYVKVVPGEEPTIHTNNINPFSIGWDPESRDLINREDAQFVDRDTWVSFNDLQEMWPDLIGEEKDMTQQGSQAFQQGKTHADRTAEFFDVKNNRYKVTERYYKVRKRKWFATNGKTRIEIKDPEKRKKYANEGFELASKSEEFLYLAMICPAWKVGAYLYNDEYHCQPRNLFTGKIMFPFVELIAESINGVPMGFVKHMVPLNRLTNSAVATIFHANKHAASTALLRKPRLFGKDETTAQSFDKNHSDADRVFPISDTADLTTDIGVVPKGTTSPDTDKSLEIGQNGLQRISSTPPSLQGQAEGPSTSGILNSQRIEQAFVQLQPFIANIKQFLKRRAELVYYYWREYFTYPMKVRIVGGQSQSPFAQQGQAQGQAPAPGQPKPTHIGINQEKPVVDWQGVPTGAIEKINDINAARYDIDIEESFQSPTYRAKRMQQLSEVMQKAGSIDPTLLDALFMEYALSTDMAQETKDIIVQHIKKKQEAANQPPQPEQKPPSLSFALKGEDLNTLAGLELIRAANFLPPELVDKLEANLSAAPNAPAPDPTLPLKAEKHASDMKMAQAKLEGQQLDNTKKLQGVADSEAEVALPGLPPSAQDSFSRHPTAFAPMGAR